MKIVNAILVIFAATLVISCTNEIKSAAAPDDSVAAQNAVRVFASRLRLMSNEEVVGSFVRAANNPKFGGYDYYLGYMTNAAVEKELAQRGTNVRSVLEHHKTDSTSIAEAINGPEESIGSVCRRLIAILDSK